MPGTQELTRRIKSVKSTRKITRAMQMVSAAKMRKAQVQALASRSYSELAWELVSSLRVVTNASESRRGNPSLQDTEIVSSGALLAMTQENPKASKIAVIIISTNRGLVGSFNANLLSKLKTIQQDNPDIDMEVATVGKKAAEGAARMRMNMIADFTKSEGSETVESVYSISAKITQMYQSGEYQKVFVIYNHYVSTLVQKATVKQLLPFAADVMPASVRLSERSLSKTEPVSRAMQKLDSGQPSVLLVASGMTKQVEYEFEPSPEAVINHLVPRILESQLYQAILESDASEHSARMIMMKNATDAAGDLITDLTLTFNQLRQNKITTELSEITAGKIALEK